MQRPLASSHAAAARTDAGRSGSVAVPADLGAPGDDAVRAALRNAPEGVRSCSGVLSRPRPAFAVARHIPPACSRSTSISSRTGWITSSNALRCSMETLRARRWSSRSSARSSFMCRATRRQRRRHARAREHVWRGLQSRRRPHRRWRISRVDWPCSTDRSGSFWFAWSAGHQLAAAVWSPRL